MLELIAAWWKYVGRRCYNNEVERGKFLSWQSPQSSIAEGLWGEACGARQICEDCSPGALSSSLLAICPHTSFPSTHFATLTFVTTTVFLQSILAETADSFDIDKVLRYSHDSHCSDLPILSIDYVPILLYWTQDVTEMCCNVAAIRKDHVWTWVVRYVRWSKAANRLVPTWQSSLFMSTLCSLMDIDAQPYVPYM